MKTRKRPGIVTCEVRRAPFVPSGSFTTWTMISWPSLSSSSIFAFGRSRSPRESVRPGAAPAPPSARGRPPPSPLASSSSSSLSNSSERVDDVGDVEESVALEADVDEGGLHAGQDLRHAALVDVADDAALPLALDEDFGDEVVLEDGHHGFVAVGGDDHLLVHFTNSMQRLAPGDRHSGGESPNR